MTTRQEELQNKIFSWFFGFWVKKYRISYLLVLLLIGFGLISAINIPKESTPNVELGMINITTIYPGANPKDVDSLITDKIYKQIENIENISKITSTSSLGISSILISVKNWSDIDKILNEVRNKVSNISLPSWAKESNITNIETKNSIIFSMYVYDKNNNASYSQLIEKSQNIKEELEKLSTINKATIDNSDYEAQIIISNEKLKEFNLTLTDISSAINNYNRDQPIGNFEIGYKKYDYRIAGKYENISDFLQTPINLKSGWNIILSEIAEIKREYKKDIQNEVLDSQAKLHNAVMITVEKKDSATIFKASSQAKEKIKNIFSEQWLSNYGYEFSHDIAEIVTSNYTDLAKEAINTLFLVFIGMFFFVGFKDALFSIIVIPLAFLWTFLTLYKWWYSMNMLTNFSLIIAFGIAIDTVVVFVQAASIKIRVGFNPKTAIALALKEYAIPTIIGVITTVIVFVPMLVLPGMLGKFLSFIPVTITGVLIWGLVLALTVNIALYILFIRPSRVYIKNPEITNFLSNEEKELLEIERKWKILVTEKNIALRTRILTFFVDKYKKIMQKILPNKLYRRWWIIFVIAFFFFGSMFLAPMINFEMMPADDNDSISFKIEWANWLTTTKMNEEIGNLEKFFDSYPEIKDLSITTSWNISKINIRLYPKAEREKLKQKNAFAIEKELYSKLDFINQKWLKLTSDVAWMWDSAMWWGWDVGINLIVEDSNNLSSLIAVSKDFENFLKSLETTKNITTSANQTPGQFVINLNKWLLSQKNISPSIIYSKINEQTNWLTVGTIKNRNNDIDVVIKNSLFIDKINPEQILDINFVSGNINYRIGDFVEIKPQNAIEQIERKNWDILITVSADLNGKADSIFVSNQIIAFAEKYNFPNWISYSMGWENEENSELVEAMLSALIISVFAIFGILTLQFNSFLTPLIVFYSVFMATPFVFLGLLITDNPFSLMFFIGFIAFMWVSVNHGIILLDAINVNLEKWMDTFTAMIEAGASRLEPMLLTTITTVLGMIPIALKGKMWAWIGWTITFGLIACTFITLFTFCSVYYEIFMKKSRKSQNNFIKNFFNKLFSKKISRKIENHQK